jgi:uncharacterized protein (UPF0261 family)
MLTSSQGTHMAGSKRVYAVGTMDSKGHELAFVAQHVERAGADVVVVDVGTQADPAVAADVSRQQVAACHPDGADAVLRHNDRGRAVTAMGEALVQFLLREHAAGKVAGVIGIGGTGGTALISPAMRALPVGLPKVLVSTVASGNTAQYVGSTDITMMYSVVDVAGLNRVSQQVLSNAAYAVAGMALHHAAPAGAKPAVGMTMFGVTTPCVTAVRQHLEARGFECLVFHATGTGGQAMEKLVQSDLLGGVLDVTTTEVADEVVGGVFPAGPARFDVILEKRIPYVMSVGALDMVNFGAKDTVPQQFKNRRLHVHNANVTLMRTTPAENRQFAEWIARKVNRTDAPLTLLIPEGGVSALDAPGQPFHDPEADRALFEGLEELITLSRERRIVRLPHHINDPAFAQALVAAFLEIQQ